MPRYSFRAVDESGKTQTGVLDADSPQHLGGILAARGQIPTGIQEVARKRASSGAFSSVKPMELALFTKQFSTMLRCGVPMTKVLDILRTQTENARLKAVVTDMARVVKDGGSLSTAMKAHPKIFSPLYIGMVSAGETSGSLPEVLERLIYIIEHEAKLKGDVKSALQYPMIVMIALSVAFVVLLTFVIPKFATVFNRSGLQLPLPTRICMSLSDILRNYGVWMLLALAVAVIGVVMYVRTPEGRFMRDTLLMRLPVVGPLMIRASVSRFASVFAILQASGMAVLDSMRLLSKTIGNAAVGRELEKIEGMLQEGRGISRPLAETKYFTPMLVNMVAVGEETGNLDEMLREVSRHYDAEVEFATKKLSDLIGPTLIVTLAVVVGFFALAIYMPMWEMGKASVTSRPPGT
jgi:type II secretory pathway component PulF